MVVLLYLKDATLGFLTDTSAIKDMLTPGLGNTLLTSSSFVTLMPFILIMGSLTRNIVNIKTMIMIARRSKEASGQAYHLMNFLLP